MIGMFIQDWWRHSFRVACWNVRHFGQHHTPLEEAEASALLDAQVGKVNSPERRARHRLWHKQNVVSRKEGETLFRRTG